MTTYTTRGSVRGSCGHNHRTLKAAEKCIQADQARCRSQGGYSDRVTLVVSDGVSRPLTESEYEESLTYGRYARA